MKRIRKEKVENYGSNSRMNDRMTQKLSWRAVNYPDIFSITITVQTDLEYVKE